MAFPKSWRYRQYGENILPGRFCCVFPVLAISLFAAPPLSSETKVYSSPDGSLRAIVVTEATGESRVEIQASHEQVLLGRDERSRDGNHGHTIVEAAWTSDSQFFVASTASTGGHQPWARPLWVYSSQKNQIFELWKFGVSATGAFTLKTPDITEVPILGCAGTQSRILVFSLHRFLATGRVPIAPCPGK